MQRILAQYINYQRSTFAAYRSATGVMMKFVESRNRLLVKVLILTTAVSTWAFAPPLSISSVLTIRPLDVQIQKCSNMNGCNVIRFHSKLPRLYLSTEINTGIDTDEPSNSNDDDGDDRKETIETGAVDEQNDTIDAIESAAINWSKQQQQENASRRLAQRR